jgi:hypothetical protein
MLGAGRHLGSSSASKARRHKGLSNPLCAFFPLCLFLQYDLLLLGNKNYVKIWRCLPR